VVIGITAKLCLSVHTRARHRARIASHKRSTPNAYAVEGYVGTSGAYSPAYERLHSGAKLF